MGPRPRLISQVLGAIAEFNKAMTVAKLRGARERIRKEKGKCEGRKAFAEIEKLRPAVALAKQLHGTRPKSGKRQTGKRHSLREISKALEAAGYLNERGKPFNPKSIKSMLDH
jgi:DNA invertase Pin-like site-specific DNA recombinase